MSKPRSNAPYRRRLVVASTVVLVTLVGMFTVGPWGEPPGAPLEAPIDPRYPDLAMAPVGELLVGHEEGGHVFLRFSATLVNVGAGPLLIAAHRSLPLLADWRAVQRIEDGGGLYSEQRMPTRLVFGGDGHDHWHVVGAVAHQLESQDGRVVAGLVKSGFCFFDNVQYRELPGTPPSATHAARECGNPFDRDITMGLSIGWGDEYQWYLLDQAIDITTVPDGRYRLRATADPAGEIAEEDDLNNDVLTEVEIATVDGRRRVTKIESPAE